MEYVDGATLRELLASGPLPNEKLLRYATQIAEGLGKAHQAGIVHRDLKPENLMITGDGHAKILDFGLAKLLPSLTPSDSHSPILTKEDTATGAVMGTASYMSPEQALGKSLDARTDVFSLGAVVFEMATGARPFQGETLAALFDEILHKKAPPPSRLNTGLLTSFDGIIQRALAKDPEKRYPSATEFLTDLHQMSPDATIRENAEKKSVLVLPFENVSPDPEQEYFCDGMTDEIISNLSNVQSLRVISRTSSMRFKGVDKNIKTIGEELNVQYILEGSVRKAGNDLRITAQLIDATNDAQLWAERYSGTLDDIFDVQEKVSQSIVDALEINLSPEEKQKIAERPFKNDVGTELCLFYEAGVNGGATTGPRTLSEDTRTFYWKDPDLAWLVADAYALHGDKDETLRWLERTVERDWINYPLWQNDPLLESVRGEERFQQLMEEVKHKWESFRR